MKVEEGAMKLELEELKLYINVGREVSLKEAMKKAKEDITGHNFVELLEKEDKETLIMVILSYRDQINQMRALNLALM